jgi:hypothetical protein
MYLIFFKECEGDCEAIASLIRLLLLKTCRRHSAMQAYKKIELRAYLN